MDCGFAVCNCEHCPDCARSLYICDRLDPPEVGLSPETCLWLALHTQSPDVVGELAGLSPSSSASHITVSSDSNPPLPGPDASGALWPPK